MLVSSSLKHYSATELDEQLHARKDVLLLDVRTGGERKNGHIQGSLHIPLHELSGRMKELEKYKQQEIVCYCASGSRSVVAASKLKKHGFTVANLKGGISGWNFLHR